MILYLLLLQVVFIPQGLMHFSHNQACSPAAFIANFGHRDPGTQTIWASLMAIPTPILAVHFRKG